MTNITELLDEIRDCALTEKTERQRRLAAISALNWQAETRDLIKSEVQQFSPRKHGRWVPIPPIGLATTFQVDLHTDEMLPCEIGGNKLIREEPASLVYSLHPNGSIAVIATPHSSSHSQNPARSIIIDVIPHAWYLAGAVGRVLVRRHLREFSKLAAATRAHARPSAATGRFLQQIGGRAERFAFVFPSSGEARRHRLSQEANLGIGLIAGLMASTIWPFARDFGTEAGRDAEATFTRCKHDLLQGQPFDTCLQQANYWTDKALSVSLSTGALLILALALTFSTLWIVWRIKQQR